MLLFARTNTLELKNVPEDIRLVSTSDSNIKPTSITEITSLDEIEKLHILKILEQEGGDKVNTAKILGIGLKTLYRNFSKYNSLLSI